jgi:predicted PurR-regulated permease PerM
LIEQLRAWARAETLVLPAWIERFPPLAGQLRHVLDLMSDPAVRNEWLREALGALQPLLHLGRNFLQIVVDVFLTLFTLFFVYRDGEDLLGEVRKLLDRIAGGRALLLLDAVRETVRAVLYGWLLTAAGQGLVAMLGFWIVGLGAPVLLGVATGVAALVPFGVGLVWIPVIVWLAIGGVWWKVIFMASWSLAVVSIIDNILRPLFISGPSRIPFIIVFFGVLGGLATYGLLGLVLGPVLLAVLLALWRQSSEVLAEQQEKPAAAEQ